MIAEIVAIGTELLMGQVANTDAQFLARRLSALGISVYYHTVVGDNPARMESTLRQALERSDIVITTGGLGPTQDDLSKQIAARLMGLEMVEDAASLAAIQAYFDRLGRKMAENNRRQAYFARGAKILPNARGTAPGCILEQGGKMIVQLPGPPYELTHMFDTQVFPYLEEKTGGVIASRYVRIYGMGESDVETRVRDLIDAQGEVTIAPYCSMGEVQLRVSARGESEAAALEKLMPTLEAIGDRLGSVIYAVADSSDESMERCAARLLLEKGLTVSTAESCTGGMVAAKLVNVPGVSAALGEAYVTYANEAKERLLGVSHETLEVCGAVSEQTAREMAQGLRTRTGVDIAVATTGIAGPDGGTAQKPVGLVYTACASAHGVAVREHHFLGDREKIRTLSTLAALDMIRCAALAYTQKK